MIAAYIGSAAIGFGIYLALRRQSVKIRLRVAIGVFVVLCTLFTVWFINTGGHYGIIGKNGMMPNLAGDDAIEQY
ncbi:hypothetical protein M8994_09080 [Brucella sp. 21LCYQ03]|nr:hypothetical protein [Brucella sp. 21LCYQ03]